MASLTQEIIDKLKHEGTDFYFSDIEVTYLGNNEETHTVLYKFKRGLTPSDKEKALNSLSGIAQSSGINIISTEIE